ncbi:hypothetical protein EON66_08540 [archaeon]|nr:MAG: hypothetical protein EON66_08540 [archaeon]
MAAAASALPQPLLHAKFAGALAGSADAVLLNVAARARASAAAPALDMALAVELALATVAAATGAALAGTLPGTALDAVRAGGEGSHTFACARTGMRVALGV